MADEKVGKYLDLQKLSVTPLNTKLLCLLKVGAKEHIESLADGTIYCRHITYYKDPQFKDHPFFDEHEGLDAVLQSDLVKLTIGSPKMQSIELGSENGLVGSVIVAGNIALPAFCLHAIHTGEWTHREFTEAEIDVFKSYLQIPNEMFKFKDYVWIITDFNKFLERLGSALDREGIGARHGFVKYVDLGGVHGKVAPEMRGFIKKLKHAEEREYRFIFSSKEKLPDPFTISIGSLRDISMIMSLKEFMSKWTVDFD